MRQTPKVQERARGPLSPCQGGARISPAAGAAKNVEFFCLFVCPSHFCERCTAGVRQVAPVVLRELYYLFALKIVVRNCR